MLTLTRRAGQKINIGADVEVVVLGVSGGKVRIGVRAPRSLPIHRAELLERVEAENRRAMSNVVEQSIAAGHQLDFPEGLFGLREHTAFVLCDLDANNPIRCLVSCLDPKVQLLVIDADELWPGYPSDLAKACHPHDEEVALAIIVHVPGDGTPPTANTMAPLVIGLESREGRQFVLEHEALSVAAPVSAPHQPPEAQGASTQP